MGGSITIGSGMAAAEPDRPHVAFIGDSTFSTRESTAF